MHDHANLVTARGSKDRGDRDGGRACRLSDPRGRDEYRAYRTEYLADRFLAPIRTRLIVCPDDSPERRPGALCHPGAGRADPNAGPGGPCECHPVLPAHLPIGRGHPATLLKTPAKK